MEILEALAPELKESEDERIRKRLIEYFEGFRICNAKVKWEGLTVQDVLAWLEKQKDLTTENIYKHSRERMSFWNGQQKKQKPAEWSDEDEEMIKMILGDLEWERRNTTVDKDIRLYDEKIAWLKSLKPHWKPSEEQMEALRRVVNKLAKTDVADSVRLSIMYDNLKKL